uniref:Uncharacterized protein n=1 Tax=Nosema bombycis TaxID=27978 RepID=Q15EX2_NOSBO|nr:unknown [Nosema bombycis]
MNNIKFIKGSIRTKEKAIMKSSFDPINQNNNNFTVSDTDGNLDLLDSSVKYCSLIEQIVNQSKNLKENLQEILFEVKDFEKVYNDLSITYSVEEEGNVYSRTMYKLINHIFYNLSRLYFIESIKDDLLKFEELEKLLETIYFEISEKITLLKKKIANNKDMIVIADLEQKFIPGFKKRMRDFPKFKSLYSAIQSLENIITSSKKVESSIQSTKIIKSIELNNMENFYKFYSPLIKNSFELISKKYMENKIFKAFEDEYYYIIHNNFDQLESDSYDFVFFKYMILALKRYENNPRHLKFIFFFEYFLSMKVSTIIVKLEKEKTFYEKILLKLDTYTDQKFIVYIKSILDNIKTCSKAWKDINKVASASKTIKEKTMLDLIKESKDNAKLPYDAKLNYKTPVLSNINECIEEIDENTFYGTTKDEILEFLRHKNTVNSSKIPKILNLESNELVLFDEKEVVLPSDEIFESLPIKSFGEINEQNRVNEQVATMITNLEPRKNVDKRQEQNTVDPRLTRFLVTR